MFNALPVTVTAGPFLKATIAAVLITGAAGRQCR